MLQTRQGLNRQPPHHQLDASNWATKAGKCTNNEPFVLYENVYIAV